MLPSAMAVAQALSADEWNRWAAPCFEQVFADDNPYGEPFTPEIERRMVLFPINRELEEGQFDALARAASALADDLFYFFTVERPWSEDQLESALQEQSTVEPMEGSGDQRWAIPFDYGAYSDVGAIDVSALCSPSGRWGVLVSNDDHAVVGGSDTFIAHLLAQFPPTEEPVKHTHSLLPADLPANMSRDELLELAEALATPVPMRTGVPPGDGQVQALIEFWMYFRDHERESPSGRVGRLFKRNPQPESGDWLPGLLAHLYGNDAAAKYLDDASWR